MVIAKWVDEQYYAEESINNVLNYILTDKRTGGRVNYYGSCNVDINDTFEQFMYVKRFFNKTDGRKLLHLVVSFGKDTTSYDAYIMAYQIAAYLAEERQVIFGVHEDKDNVHIHFMINTVSFIDGSLLFDSFSIWGYCENIYKSYLAQ